MKTVLVIDEHPNLRRLYSHILSGQGYNVLTAWHPTQAQEKIELGRPDLIVVDPPMRDQGRAPSWKDILNRTGLPPVLFNVGPDKALHEFLNRPGSSRVQKSPDYAELVNKVEHMLFR